MTSYSLVVLFVLQQRYGQKHGRSNTIYLCYLDIEYLGEHDGFEVLTICGCHLNVWSRMV